MKIDSQKEEGVSGALSNESIKYGENIRITVAANQGGRKYMEDRVNIETFRNGDGTIKFTFLGVFDGHGGYEASEFVRKNLLPNIMACESFDSNKDADILSAIKEGFLATHYDMAKVVASWQRTASGYPSTAGTTCSVALIRNGKVYTGHVGDSAIIMGSYKREGERLTFDTERLTIDHKPESLDEMARIELDGGKVMQKSGVSRVVWTRPVRGHVGPVRRSTPTESIPFLAVARSLGDLWSYCEETRKYVVSPDPDLSVRELTELDACLILISDGITNVLTPPQIAQYAEYEETKLLVSGNSRDPAELHDKQPNHARQIIYQAMRRWNNLRADNLSAIVVMLDPVDTTDDVYSPYLDEELKSTASIDEMFLMDPECMIRLTHHKTQKLWTDRVALLYEGAVDNNFVSVDYRGPGFLTHDEEEELENRLMVREKLRQSFKTEKRAIETPDLLDETIDDDEYVDARQPSPSSKENIDVSPTKTQKFTKCDNEDDEDSDEEEPALEGSPEIEPIKTSKRTSKRIVEINSTACQQTPERKIATATRRANYKSTIAQRVIARTGEKTGQGVPSTPTTSNDDNLATPKSLTHLTGSRKRPSRLNSFSESSGSTPFLARLRIENSPERKDSEPVTRSEPSTPAKVADDRIRASNWSLSKLDHLRPVEEPPSKIRRIFGFVKRFVGLSSNFEF